MNVQILTTWNLKQIEVVSDWASALFLPLFLHPQIWNDTQMKSKNLWLFAARHLKYIFSSTQGYSFHKIIEFFNSLSTSKHAAIAKLQSLPRNIVPKPVKMICMNDWVRKTFCKTIKNRVSTTNDHRVVFRMGPQVTNQMSWAEHSCFEDE